MSQPFDYSKWDKLELSDDEDDVHPNIDRESWFRMKHRSRVEREEREEADKTKIHAEMEKAQQRIKVLEHDLAKLQTQQDDDDDDEDDDDDDDDLGEGDGIRAELVELQKANADRQAKLDEYEKNKTWNVDNICHVTEERTVISSDAAETKFTKEGYVAPAALPDAKPAAVEEAVAATATTEKPAAAMETKPSAKPIENAAAPLPSKPVVETAETKVKTVARPSGPPEKDLGSFETYHEFTEKYADLVEEFMALKELDQSKDFLMKNGTILLQENASNYLLLASLEDEMNGYREKMCFTARQSQIISSIAELARSLNTHPGNVIIPFFQRLETNEGLTSFMENVEAFVEKIIKRAVTKKLEMDREQTGEEGEGVDLASVPREQRLGPGGLDPLEVIETLPVEIQQAFESREVSKLKEALLQLDPAEAEDIMKRCIDSGLWVSQDP